MSHVYLGLFAPGLVNRPPSLFFIALQIPLLWVHFERPALPRRIGD